MVLEQNYPNPFNPVTNIRFTIETHGFASLQVFDITGRLVTTLVDEQLPIGQHEAVWDGSDVSSGVYLIRLSFGNLIRNIITITTQNKKDKNNKYLFHFILLSINKYKQDNDRYIRL